MTTEKKLQGSAGKVVAFILAAAVIIADQLSKFAAVKLLKFEGNSVTVIPRVLDFEYYLNPGATGGMLSDHRWVFMTVSTVVIIAMIVYIALGKVKGALALVSLGLVLGGGIGNMIDRVANGEVVDFIHVTCLPFFPFTTIFNIADTAVSVGCCMLIFAVILEEIRAKKNKTQKPSDGPEENAEE